MSVIKGRQRRSLLIWGLWATVLVTTMPALPVKKEDIDHDLANLGLPEGGLLFLHSSLSGIGNVQGGASTVVDALIDALGPGGTLVVPGFTYPDDYPDSADPDWVFDPTNTPSGMGAISNEVRTRAGALRSLHLWHSVTAVGPLAQNVVTAGNKVECSAWDANSPMAWVLDREGIIMMLGVPYQNLTAVHVWEVEFNVDYRLTQDITRRMVNGDGQIIELVSQVHVRTDWHPGSDFNRLGEQMEDQGLVRVGHVGNAVVRMFTARDAHKMARTMYGNDPKSFLKQGALTPLSYGHTIQNVRGTQCVVDPDKAFPTAPPCTPHKD